VLKETQEGVFRKPRDVGGVREIKGGGVEK